MDFDVGLAIPLIGTGYTAKDSVEGYFKVKSLF
jgi:hypothetical protein